MDSPTEIEALIARGAWAEAARALDEHGDLSRAQALYEKIWDFAAAAELAGRRGDRPDVLRLRLEGRDLPGAAAVAAEIAAATGAGAPGERRRAADLYERKGMWPEAARLRESLGDLAAARDLFRKGDSPLEAARLDETLGNLREAGAALERFLVEARAEPAPGVGRGGRAHGRIGAPEEPRIERASAEAALGRILGRFGRHDDALRHLQRALAELSDEGAAPRGSGEWVDECRRQQVVELAALGFLEGARHVFETLRAAGRTGAPEDESGAIEGETLDAFLQRRARAQQRGAAASGSGPLLAGRYEVLRLLGSGGMGRVYLARDRLTGAQVAAKVMAGPGDSRGRGAGLDGHGGPDGGWARFLREARVLTGLRHPNLVAVHEFHEGEGLLVMEYQAGGTLSDQLAEGPRPPRRVRAMLGELCLGLAAAHARGIIHRDIKPANVFFSATGEARLGDFGVAHLQDLGATQTAGFIGTLAYMSPEQITGGKLSYACDVYALGITAFQALTGRLPFAGPDFVGQHLGAAPPRPSSILPAAAPFDALIARMLEKDPAARFATLDDLGRAIAVLPLPEESSAAAAGSRAATPPLPADEARARSRYRIEAEVERTGWSVVRSAVDERLGRAVMIEDFAPAWPSGEAGARRLAWLRAMARGGGPHLQRILRIEVGDPSPEEPLSPSGEPARGLRVVYEAPIGRPLDPAVDARDPAAAAALLAGLVRGLASPHGEGIAHGSLARSVLVEDHGPTLLVAARAPAADPPSPPAELAALLALLPGAAEAPVADLASLARWAATRRAAK